MIGIRWRSLRIAWKAVETNPKRITLKKYGGREWHFFPPCFLVVGIVKRKVHIALDESLVRAIDEVRGPVSVPASSSC